jgi:hypothetical protein
MDLEPLVADQGEVAPVTRELDGHAVTVTEDAPDLEQAGHVGQEVRVGEQERP